MSLAHPDISGVPTPADDHSGHPGDHGPAPHVVSPMLLLGVYAALLVFTAITVGVSQIDLGKLNIVVCLVIAVIKGSLVVLFFMHLRWDSPFNSIVFIAALFFLAIFISIAMLDVKSYAPNYTPPQSVSAGQ